MGPKSFLYLHTHFVKSDFVHSFLVWTVQKAGIYVR